MTTPTPLSPVAQAVMKAIANHTVRPRTIAPIVAAAIQAAADVIDRDPWLQEHVDFRNELFAIAAELDGGEK